LFRGAFVFIQEMIYQEQAWHTCAPAKESDSKIRVNNGINYKRNSNKGWQTKKDLHSPTSAGFEPARANPCDISNDLAMVAFESHPLTTLAKRR
jgi:hypothetical protein